LLNSCEEELRLDLEATVKDYPEYHRTGPVYLKLITKEILVTDESAIDALKILFGKQKVSDFNGEDVSEYVAVVRGIINLLRNCPGKVSQVPTDAVSQIARGLKTTSTEEFNDMISTILTNHRTGVKTLTIEGLLTLAKDTYITLRTNGQWVKGTEKNKQDSLFFAGKCYDCGGPHKARDCPRRAQNNNGTSSGSYNGGRGGRGRGQGRGRGRGGRGRSSDHGRGGRGRGRGGGNQSNNSANGNQPDRRPPARGDPRSRNKDGRVEHWCGRCGYWTNHSTDNHHDVQFANDGSPTENNSGGGLSNNNNSTNNNSTPRQESAHVVSPGTSLVPRFS
jgi:hypothetical protein